MGFNRGVVTGVDSVRLLSEGEENGEMGPSDGEAGFVSSSSSSPSPPTLILLVRFNFFSFFFLDLSLRTDLGRVTPGLASTPSTGGSAVTAETAASAAMAGVIGTEARGGDGDDEDGTGAMADAGTAAFKGALAGVIAAGLVV